MVFFVIKSIQIMLILMHYLSSVQWKELLDAECIDDSKKSGVIGL